MQSVGKQARSASRAMATGVSGIPSLPEIPNLRNFGGTILHSSQYDDGEAWRGKRALVIGSGTSGHDIAQDLYSSGAKVTLVQRSSTMNRVPARITFGTCGLPKMRTRKPQSRSMTATPAATRQNLATGRPR